MPNATGAHFDIEAPPRKHTLVFIAFTNDELGRIGSKFYVHALGIDAS